MPPMSRIGSHRTAIPCRPRSYDACGIRRDPVFQQQHGARRFPVRVPVHIDFLRAMVSAVHRAIGTLVLGTVPRRHAHHHRQLRRPSDSSIVRLWQRTLEATVHGRGIRAAAHRKPSETASFTCHQYHRGLHAFRIPSAPLLADHHVAAIRNGSGLPLGRNSRPVGGLRPLLGDTGTDLRRHHHRSDSLSNLRRTQSARPNQTKNRRHTIVADSCGAGKQASFPRPILSAPLPPQQFRHEPVDQRRNNQADDQINRQNGDHPQRTPHRGSGIQTKT